MPMLRVVVQSDRDSFGPAEVIHLQSSKEGLRQAGGQVVAQNCRLGFGFWLSQLAQNK